MFGHHVYLAWRRCRQQPATSTLIVLTLAIGIAACMTALTIFSAFEGQPIPGVSPHLYVAAMGPADAMSSELLLRDAKALVDAHHAPFQVAMAATEPRIARAGGKSFDMVPGVMAYGQVLEVLGIPLRFGRAWTAHERRAHTPVVIIDTRVARHLFGRSDVVGRSVRIGNTLFRIIGVTAPWRPRMRFSRIEQVGGGPIAKPLEVFLPIGAALEAGVGPTQSGFCGNSAANTMYGAVNVKRCRWLETWVALPTPAAVRAWGTFLQHYAAAQHAAGRFQSTMHTRVYAMRAWMAKSAIGPAGVSLDVLLAGAFLVLCMTNVIGLLTARFLQGQTNTAIRRALGASRRQVFVQHLAESAALGLSGGLLALPLTLLGMWIVRQQPVGYAAAAQFSVWVFAGLVVLSLVVGALVGLWPAWRICRQPPALRIKEA